MIFIVFLLLVLFVIYYFHTLENFNIQTGVKKGFGYVFNPQPPCKNKNNCHSGYYFRSEAYNNCPQFTALGSTNTMTKFKKPLTYFK